MFDVFKKRIVRQYDFAAHAHLNNFSVDYKGIQFNYTMKTDDRCVSSQIKWWNSSRRNKLLNKECSNYLAIHTKVRYFHQKYTFPLCNSPK